MLLASARALYRWEAGSAAPIAEAEAPISAIAVSGGFAVAAAESGALLLLRGNEPPAAGPTLSEPVECLLVTDAESGAFLVGTEGPRIYEVHDRTATPLRAFDALDCRSEWYTPWGGPASVRSFARSGDTLYADIHVGSIVRSPDRGRTWEPVTPDLHEDVHQVATHPTAQDRVYANTADAVWISEDRGDSWSHRADGLPFSYGRAIAVHPEDPDLLLATVSRGPGANVEGRLYRSEDAGRSWHHVDLGFPGATKGNIDTFQVAFDEHGVAWAIGDGRLYASSDDGVTWESVETESEPTLLAV